MKIKDTEFMAGLGIIGAFLTLFGTWITHIVVCLLEAKYMLLIAGAIIAPVGMIHGCGIWFGVDW